jgi:hypothetical protein
VELLWESRAPTDQDLTTFVHAYSSDGELIATGDGPPLGGAFPTNYWVPGDYVLSKHELSVKPGASVARVGIGLYDPVTGARLAASSKGATVPNDTVVIWAIEP